MSCLLKSSLRNSPFDSSAGFAMAVSINNMQYTDYSDIRQMAAGFRLILRHIGLSRNPEAFYRRSIALRT
jgi:hypothetical protein